MEEAVEAEGGGRRRLDCCSCAPIIILIMHQGCTTDAPTRTKSGAQKQPNQCNAPASMRAQQGTHASPPMSAPTQSDPRIPRLRRKHVCTVHGPHEPKIKRGHSKKRGGGGRQPRLAPIGNTRPREREAETGVRIAGPFLGSYLISYGRRSL